MAKVRISKKIRKKWVRLPVDEVAIEQGCYFDEEAAEHAIGFFERFLRHSMGRKWAGKPFILLDWERDLVSRIYGWKRADGTRRYREVYLEVPKKNGKSALLSGLALLSIFEEPGSEVYQGASNRKQADIIYRECGRMVEKSPDLKKVLRVLPSKKTISFAKGNGRIKTLSADVEGEDGANSSCTILDEVHRFKNRRLYDVMQYAGAARDQPLLISISTAGIDRHSLCWELNQRARKLLEGATDDVEFLGVIYAADETDDLDDPKTWHKANPSLGIIISEQDFAKEYAAAKRIPGRLANFLRLRLGIWTNAVTRWLPLDLWRAGATKVGTSWWVGKRCFAAIDISSVKDLTALTIFCDDDDDCRAETFFFLPEETAARRAEVDGVNYPLWIEQGHIIATEGRRTDHEAIRRKLNDLKDAGLEIVKVGMDPWNAAHLANELADDEFEIVMIRQLYSTLSGPSKELERLLLDGALRHDGNPVMAWNVGNCVTESDAEGNIKPSKRKSTEKIDGVASLVMCIGLSMAFPETGEPSITILGPGSH